MKVVLVGKSGRGLWLCGKDGQKGRESVRRAQRGALGKKKTKVTGLNNTTRD